MKINLTLGDQIYEGEVNLRTVPPIPPVIPPIIPPVVPPVVPPVIPPSGPCVPPPYAQVLELDHRYEFTFAPGEKVFAIRVPDTQINRIRGQVLGLSGDTDVEGTWVMPDCKEFKAYATGTDNASWLDIRSQHAVQPNIDFEYIPAGDHTFRVKANAQSSVIIWFTAYQ